MVVLLSGCESGLVASGSESIVGTSSTRAPAVTGTPPLTTNLETGSNISEQGTGAAQFRAFCSAFQTHPMLKITLLFGQTRPHGKPISAAEWREFVNTTLTPTFSTGLSILSAQGQWKDTTTNRLTQEPSRLVMVLTEPTQDLTSRLETVRNRYKTRFQQDSVGITISAACAGF
ncbi:DUF3574 domain-containing protein [Acetobacter orleanensis]|nr:DUF3574 domain-containing protein [Acetobacter orleanensis]GBR22858.1 hypothetical protein AA0473_0234 [Acetobacter orleanensis NRIC 0473]